MQNLKFKSVHDYMAHDDDSSAEHQLYVLRGTFR